MLLFRIKAISMPIELWFKAGLLVLPQSQLSIKAKSEFFFD
jgi:hypothetical protein